MAFCILAGTNDPDQVTTTRDISRSSDRLTATERIRTRSSPSYDITERLPTSERMLSTSSKELHFGPTIISHGDEDAGQCARDHNVNTVELVLL